jgi:catechol 2,3-dioxygenase-like lactoylglutathione lyase family enzyme
MPARLGHLRLDVNDLDRATKFYTDVLGLVVRERATDDESHYAFLTDDPEGMHHRLVLRQSLDPSTGSGSALGDTTRLDHFAWEVDTPSEWVEIVDRLETRGLDLEFGEAGIAWQVYFHDPEGVKLEVYVDRRDATGGRALWHGQQDTLDPNTVRDAAD